VTPARYDLYSGTSKNWLINCRQGVIRPQFRSLKAHSGTVSKRADSVLISCSGLKKLVESTIILLLISTRSINVGSSRPGGSPSHHRYTGRSGLSKGCIMFAIERTADPDAKMVACSKQWRIKSEIMEKQRNVTHAWREEGACSPLSRIKRVTRAK